jgi:hypothetical protein
MRREDILSVLLTFLVGVIAGGYFYISNAAGLLTKLETPDVEKVSEFVIVADVYGGCRSTCPSFQVQNDASYRYLYTPGVGAEKIIRQGQISRELMTQLRKVITKETLMQQATKIQPAVCNSYTDGLDITYEISLDGEVFVLNSCGTDVDSDSALWQTLGGVWDFFERGK